MLMDAKFSHRAGDNPLSALRARWRDHEEFMATGTREPDLRLGIAASFTANNLVPFLGTGLLDRGFLPRVRLAPHNQIFQACADYETYFGADSNCALLLWRIEDLLMEELALFAGGGEQALARALAKLDQLTSSVLRMRSLFPGTMILGLPPLPTHGLCALSALESETSPMAFHGAITQHIRDAIDAASGIHLFDMGAIQADFGASGSLDWRQWYLYRQPFKEAFLHRAAAQLVRVIAASRKAPKKCIVLDADNTLWGGVIGEDGLDGIALGDDFPGSAYRDFQRLLLHLRGQGFFLAVASKNNPADIEQVFDRHQGMILKREHVSAWAVNWQPKADAIPTIAQTLGIGTDTLVFIDDNPMEIAQMRQTWPEVISIQLPDEPAEFIPFLQTLTCFDSANHTQEDRQRADMMRAEGSRQALRHLALAEFQRALELRIAFSPAADHELGRATQLINKTNQFNLTTIRRTLDDMRVLSRSPRHRVYALKVRDKFGDYGLTGVVIIERPNQTNWAIDTLLLSCRVLGRGVEKALLAVLAEEARAEGVHTITARFVPTDKNSPAGDFLARQGFSHVAGQDWCIRTQDVPMLDSFIERM